MNIIDVSKLLFGRRGGVTGSVAATLFQGPGVVVCEEFGVFSPCPRGFPPTPKTHLGGWLGNSSVHRCECMCHPVKDWHPLQGVFLPCAQ